jgi:hypothetical protein
MQLPYTYAAWKSCITQSCGIPLTTVFLHDRLEKLTDRQDAHTRDYIVLYGETYHQQVIGWFRQALMEHGPTAL